ncbi:MAG: hypothetical protein P4M01_13045 [Acidobacteriota bacterium]|nr:hypothetical protein [Acidobacteriota bacterium]
MKLTIDNLAGAGEVDYTALLDAEAPPKIVRKLNAAPRLTAQLACTGAQASIAAGAKVRLYRDAGGFWFTGYLTAAPRWTCVGQSQGADVFRVLLQAAGELSILDRVTLSERESFGGLTAGGQLAALAVEANPNFNISNVQDVASGSTLSVESGAPWNATASAIANAARAAVTSENRALTLAPVGTATRTLNDTDAGFVPSALKLQSGAPAANDITVLGPDEAALYVHDSFTATGTETYFTLWASMTKSTAVVLVEDDFHTMAVDATKWVNDAAAALTFTTGGVAAAGAVALRYRNGVELGGLTMLEQTGVSYASGTGIFGGLFSGGEDAAHCVAGVMVTNGSVQAVVGGVVKAVSATLAAGMLYEFRTLLFHPDMARAGQVYASSANHGAQSRTAQTWAGTARVVLTMRQINPADHSTLSTQQVAIYDGTLTNAPAFANYLAMWGTSLNCTLGIAKASQRGAVWVRSCPPGGAWRTRVLGNTADGAECSVASRTLTFTAASEPVLNEFIEVFYRTTGLASARVTNAASVAAMANSEDTGRRAKVVRVTHPAPRTSLDCEQAALALLDDLTLVPWSATYEAWAERLPVGNADVAPGEAWTVNATRWGATFTALVREVEIAFAALSDRWARYTVQMANDAAELLGLKCGNAQHALPAPVVTSQSTDNALTRPLPLEEARFTTWTASTMTVDAGTAPPAGGGIEVRVEGDWGWGMTINQNLVGRYTTQTITLPNTDVTQTFYLRQYDASTPPRYSPYSTVLTMEVPA